MKFDTTMMMIIIAAGATPQILTIISDDSNAKHMII